MMPIPFFSYVKIIGDFLHISILKYGGLAIRFLSGEQAQLKIPVCICVEERSRKHFERL